MNVLIRADASPKIGVGHVMRCLTLALSLQKHAENITFCCYSLPDYLEKLLVSKDFDVQHLSQYDQQPDCSRQTFSLAIVDHYNLDYRWEARLRSKVAQIMVIDDIANRSHDCDYLLDQNEYADPVLRYQNKIPAHCQTYFGARYALLREQFLQARARISPIDSVRRILVFMGGADHNNATCKVLDAIDQSQFDGAVDVVVGAVNIYHMDISKKVNAHSSWTMHHNVNNMAELMLQSQLAIGACGGHTWERCCIGLPSMVLTIADNQIESAQCLQQKGVVHYLGEEWHVTVDGIANAINENINNIEYLNILRDKSLSLVDGLGCNKICGVVSV